MILLLCQANVNLEPYPTMYESVRRAYLYLFDGHRQFNPHPSARHLLMNTLSPISYKRHSYPAGIIS